MWLVGPETVSANLLHDGHRAGNEMCIEEARAKRIKEKCSLKCDKTYLKTILPLNDSVTRTKACITQCRLYFLLLATKISLYSK